MTTKAIKIVRPKDFHICQFCRTNVVDIVHLGDMYRIGDIYVHYLCCLLSETVAQNGTDEEGLLGFLIRDIKEEVEKHKTSICFICKKFGATIKCMECHKKWHLPCGTLAKERCFHIFENDFPSFCNYHRPKQSLSKEARNFLMSSEPTQVTCPACFEAVDPKNRTEFLWAKCCQKTFYHRSCVEKLALAEGYLFKCAICSNSTTFKTEMIKHGIYVPDRDAIWEHEPDAFQDLLYQYSRCDAEECKCKQGRDYDGSGSQWEIVVCSSCGSNGIHVACGQLKFFTNNWECNGCKSVTTIMKSQEKDAPKKRGRPFGSVKKRPNKRKKDNDSLKETKISNNNKLEVEIKTEIDSTLTPIIKANTSKDIEIVDISDTEDINSERSDTINVCDTALEEEDIVVISDTEENSPKMPEKSGALDVKPLNLDEITSVTKIKSDLDTFQEGNSDMIPAPVNEEKAIGQRDLTVLRLSDTNQLPTNTTNAQISIQNATSSSDIPVQHNGSSSQVPNCPKPLINSSEHPYECDSIQICNVSSINPQAGQESQATLVQPIQVPTQSQLSNGNTQSQGNTLFSSANLPQSSTFPILSNTHDPQGTVSQTALPIHHNPSAETAPQMTRPNVNSNFAPQIQGSALHLSLGVCRDFQNGSSQMVPFAQGTPNALHTTREEVREIRHVQMSGTTFFSGNQSSVTSAASNSQFQQSSIHQATGQQFVSVGDGLYRLVNLPLQAQPQQPPQQQQQQTVAIPNEGGGFRLVQCAVIHPAVPEMVMINGRSFRLIPCNEQQLQQQQYVSSPQPQQYQQLQSQTLVTDHQNSKIEDIRVVASLRPQQNSWVLHDGTSQKQ